MMDDPDHVGGVSAITRVLIVAPCRAPVKGMRHNTADIQDRRAAAPRAAAV